MERRLGSLGTGPLALASGLLLSTACYTQASRDGLADDETTFDAEAAPLRPAAELGCGDGTLAGDEECDPAAEGWGELCDYNCKRTQYEPCTHYEQCPGLNSNCVAYTANPEHQFCGAYCESDDDCPVLPGYEAGCNFAWCVVRCEGKLCPNGMTCVVDQSFIDHEGQSKGVANICLPTPGL